MINHRDRVNRCGIEPIVKLQVSTEHKHLNKVCGISRKVLIGKSMPQSGFCPHWSAVVQSDQYL